MGAWLGVRNVAVRVEERDVLVRVVLRDAAPGPGGEFGNGFGEYGREEYARCEGGAQGGGRL